LTIRPSCVVYMILSCHGRDGRALG
jgi:hypothetical protein